MIKYQKRWLISGIIFTLVDGTLLHYVFEWSGNSPIAGLFSAVNESTWEHLKLIFWPMLLFGIIEYLAFEKRETNFIPSRVISIIVGMAAIIIIFYTYTGIIGEHYLVADIATFIISVIIAYMVGWKLINSNLVFTKKSQALSILLLIVLIAFFIIFTNNPPQLDLFLDQSTGTWHQIIR